MKNNELILILDFGGQYNQLIARRVRECNVYSEVVPFDISIEKIKEKGLLAGVAINPATPVSAISCVLEKVDMVLVMTVNPGFGGQKLIPYTVEKVRELRKIVDEKGLKTDIEVDGGVNLSNVEELMDAGANIIVAGSAIFSGDVTENTIRFLNIINE